MFRSCLVNGLLDEPRVRQAVRQVIARKPRGYLAILAHFQRLVTLDMDRHAARVDGAAPLSPALQTKLQQDLTRVYGPGLKFAFAQNPALIGGMRVKVGSDVYDGSIKARLNALVESF